MNKRLIFNIRTIKPPYKSTDFIPEELFKNEYILSLLKKEGLSEEERYNSVQHFLELEMKLKNSVYNYNNVIKKAIDFNFVDTDYKMLYISIEEKDNFCIRINTKEIKGNIPLSAESIEYMIRTMRSTIAKDITRYYSDIHNCLIEFERDYPNYLNINEDDYSSP